MKTLIKILPAVLLAAALQACNKSDFYPCVSGSGNLVSETRNLPEFHSVDFRMDGDVEVVQGSQYRVEVSGYENQNEQVKTTISNGKLIVEANQCLRKTKFSFKVTMPNLYGFKMQGSSSAHIINFDSIWDVTLDLTGSGDIIADLKSPKIYTKVTGSGHIELAGTTASLTSQLTGSGHVNAYGLTTNTAFAEVSGSGYLKTQVSDFLDVYITGSGKVYYKGNPVVTTAITGSGKLVKE